jgi:hypothetical protein
MKEITLSCLKCGLYKPGNFQVGEKVRIYINYNGSCNEVDVREGIVLNPASSRWDGYVQRLPALRLKVERAGRVVRKGIDFSLGTYHSHNRTPKRKYPYTRDYIYMHIGLVEKI